MGVLGCESLDFGLMAQAGCTERVERDCFSPKIKKSNSKCKMSNPQKKRETSSKDNRHKRKKEKKIKRGLVHRGM